MSEYFHLDRNFCYLGRLLFIDNHQAGMPRFIVNGTKLQSMIYEQCAEINETIKIVSILYKRHEFYLSINERNR